MERLEALMQICDSDSFGFYSYFIGKNITNSSIVQTLNGMAIKMGDSIFACKWRKNKNCSNLFKPILTEDGICFTFNSLNSHDIYTDEYDRFHL